MSSSGQVKLKEFAELVNQPYQPSSDEKINYIGLEHIEQQTLRLSGIGNSSDVISQKHKFKAGDILFGKLRPYFRKVVRPSFDGVCSTDIWVVRAKSGFDQSFLFYFLANKSFIDECNSSSSGTRMPRADWNHLSETLWELPTLPEQKRIAEILSALDDKIELNRQTNATLEAIAQAIFKEWFVDFNYPGATGELVESELGFIPKGWRVEKIGKILKTKLGGTPSTKKKEYWENGIIPWINSGKVNEFRIIEPSTYITKEAVRKSNTKLLPKRTVVIAITGATLGQVSLLEIDSCANQSVIGILENESIPSEYIYLWVVSNIQSIISNQSGGAQQHINTNDVNNSLIVVPDYQVLTNFHQLISPVFDRESLLCFESASLAKIRDLLLPRLMNGEIEV